MIIELYDFHPSGSKQPITMGLGLSKIDGLTYANLFAIAENEGPPVHAHLWPIAHDIAKNILQGETVDDVNWSFTCMGRTSEIKFTTFDGKPCKMDLSDIGPIKYEKLEYVNDRRGTWTHPLETYARNFDGQPPQDVSKGLRLTLTKEPEPVSVFTAPVNHPDALNKVFYCIPSFYDAPHMRDNYVFILADIKKVIRILEGNDSEFLQKPSNESSALEGLTCSEITSPCDMGSWTVSRHKGLTLGSGYAEYLRLARELQVPFFPMAIEKALGEDRIRDIWETVGIGASRQNKPIQEFKPAY